MMPKLTLLILLFISFSSAAQKQKITPLPPKNPTVAGAQTAPAAKENSLFEGYYKIMSSNQHIGYMALRFEFDSKKKIFTSTHFMRTEAGGVQSSESLVSRSDENFTPLSYEYTQLSGGSSTIIDAKFKNNKMTANFQKDGAKKVINKDLPKGTFLSSFLVYMMMKSPNGMTTQTRFQYQALAEEDAEIFKGEAIVGKEEDFKGLKVLKVVNKFKNASFISHLTDRGEVVGTESKDLAVSTELVASKEEAFGKLTASEKTLSQLFGSVPLGANNLITKTANRMQSQKNGTNDNTVPAGIGIQTKADGSEKEF